MSHWFNSVIETCDENCEENCEEKFQEILVQLNYRNLHDAAGGGRTSTAEKILYILQNGISCMIFVNLLTLAPFSADTKNMQLFQIC